MAVSYKSSTIRRRVNSLGRLSVFSHLPDPSKAPEVILALKRIHRKLGRAQKQAFPLTRPHLDQMMKRCRYGNIGLRNKVLLLLGYETMRRRSELCEFRFEDLMVLPTGKYAINLRFSKTDPYGYGKLIPISDTLYKLIKRWQKKVGIESGYILRTVLKNDRITYQLCSNAVNTILIDLQHRAKLRHLPPFTGHSFRVGAALDLLQAGVPLEKIMLLGGWKSETTALRYLSRWVELELGVLGRA